MTEPADRIYSLSQALGRLEGHVEQLAIAIRREHEERVAALAEHKAWNQETDARIEHVLKSLADKIELLTNTVANNKSDIQDIRQRKADSVSAWRWFVGTAFALISISNIWVNHNTNTLKHNIDEALQKQALERLQEKERASTQSPSDLVVP